MSGAITANPSHTHVLMSPLPPYSCPSDGRKKINHMRMQVSPVGRNFLHRMNTNTDACAEEEAEISEFMAAIRSYFSDESVRSRDSDISFHLLNEMKLLLVFLGRVCDLNDALLMEGCKDSKSIEGSYVRLLLRIWSCSLETAFLASQSSLLPADIQLVVPTDFTGPLPSQILSLLMADLMSICWNRFVSFPVNGDLTTLSPFPAHFFNQEVTEIRETVLKYQNADSYWSVVNMIIQRTEDWNEQDSQSIYHFPLLPRSLKKAKETKIAQLWLFLILSRNQTPPCSLNPNVLVSLVKDVVQRDTPFLDSSCTNILLVIQIVRSLFESLNPNVDLLFPFFELLIKRLNKSDGLLTRELPKHGSEWAQLITHPKPYNDTRQDLCLSVLSLVELIARNQGPEGDLERSSQLQRLKGRLYSKIQPKRLLDVSEHGLFKFLSFFVGIGSWKPDQWPEMSDKVCEIAHKIFERGENCKILLTVKCLFALLYLMPANCDASRVKQILIRQIPLLSSPDSKHPIAVSCLLSFPSFVLSFCLILFFQLCIPFVSLSPFTAPSLPVSLPASLPEYNVCTIKLEGRSVIDSLKKYLFTAGILFERKSEQRPGRYHFRGSAKLLSVPKRSCR